MSLGGKGSSGHLLCWLRTSLYVPGVVQRLVIASSYKWVHHESFTHNVMVKVVVAVKIQIPSSRVEGKEAFRSFIAPVHSRFSERSPTADFCVKVRNSNKTLHPFLQEVKLAVLQHVGVRDARCLRPPLNIILCFCRLQALWRRHGLYVRARARSGKRQT